MVYTQQELDMLAVVRSMPRDTFDERLERMCANMLVQREIARCRRLSKNRVRISETKSNPHDSTPTPDQHAP